MLSFQAKIAIIGINPYVPLPEDILAYLFERSGRTKGPIPVKIEIGGVEFIQTLVKYAGEWRLYLNTPIRNVGKTIVGDLIIIGIDYDSAQRETPMHSKLREALDADADTKGFFDRLTPSRQKEIMRYINHLKSEESIDRNVTKAVANLLGKEKITGRQSP